MNGPFQVAQASGTSISSTTGSPVRIYKLTKPLTDQAVMVNLGYDQQVKVDFSAIANEKITLVHIGEKLIILFDNESTVTVEPFFKSRADGLGNDTRDEIMVEMAPGRDISVKEFATLFPITTDASVLPAADQGGNSNGNAQASGAYFSQFSVDPLDPVTLNKLAPQEELGNFVLEIPTGGNVIPDQAGDNLRPDELPPSALADRPTILVGPGQRLIVDESFIPLVGSQTLVAGTPNSNRDSQDFAGAFTIVAPAGVKSLTFALTIQDPVTNLIDVATGQSVRLVSNGSGEVDGVITINNTQITVFTLTVDGTGTVTFEVLEASRQFVQSADVLEGISPNAGLVSLTATVTDNNAATAIASIDLGPLITVFDDVPTAVADTETVAAGTQGPATGNVITDAAAGDEGDTDSGADTRGADDAVVAGVAAGNTNVNLDNAATLNTAIQGTYGKLTLLADGSYSYVRDAGTAGGHDDVFTYTLKDSDGDLSHTTLTISIGDSTPTDMIPGPGGATTTVFEKGLAPHGALPAGSGEIADSDPTNNSDPSETVAGTIAFTSVDGVSVVSLGGHALTNAAQTFTDATGSLTASYSYDAVSGAGTISYSYTLLTNTSGDATNVSFPVVVTDADGDNAPAGNLVINIVDDVPTAHADTDATLSGQFTAEAGNVITAVGTTSPGGVDVLGADDAAVAGVAAGNTNVNLDSAATLNSAIQGTYGKLTLLADGSYSYVRDAGTAGGHDDVFTYTLKDSDGDLSHTTLTISIGDSTPTDMIPGPGGATTTVFEKGLAPHGALPTGSGEIADSDPTNNSDPSETVAGTIAFTSVDGVSVVSLGGHALTNAAQTFTDATGSLTASYSYDAVSGAGTISYSYTLLTNTSGDVTNVIFPVVVTDADGDNAPAGNLVINIVDDVPTAHADTDSVASAVQTLNFDDFGLGDNAETPIGSPYHGFNFIQTGVYNPPGSGPFATYAPHSGSSLAFIGEKNGVDQPGYTGTPGDPITIAHTDGSRFTALGAWFSSNGSEPMTITVFGYVNGISVGSISQDIHQGGAGGPTYVDLSVLGSVDKIVVDGPGYFGFDDFSYVDNSTTATGNVITAVGTTSPGGVDVLGADGAVVSGVAAGNTNANLDSALTVGSAIQGTYGKLTLLADGSYSYVRDAGTAGGHDDVFTYTLKDGDGDLSHTTLTISIGDSTPTDMIPGPGGATTTVFEKGLAPHGALPAGAGEIADSDPTNNSDPSETVAGTIAFTSVDGVSVVSLGGHALTNAAQTFTDATGSLTASYSYDAVSGVGTISYSYTLLTNTSGDNTNVSFPVVVTDADGDNAPAGNLVINIIDDVPTADVDSGNVNEGALLTVAATSGVLINDVAGADGFTAGGGVVGVRAAGADTTTAVTTGVNASITGLHGTLVLQANGGYTYQSTANNIAADTTDVFVYTIKDGDGDLSTTTLTINLADVTIVAPADSDVTVNESALDTTIAGSDLAAGTITGSLGTNSALETDATNQLNATGGFGGLTYALVSGGNAATAGTYGTIKVNTDGSYIYTLTKPFDTSPDANNGANIEGAESFQYKVTDANGNTSIGTITVNIVDDVPTAVNDGVIATHAEHVAGVTIGTVVGLLSNDQYGADGAAAAGSITIGAGDHGGTVTIVSGNLVYTNTNQNVTNGQTVDETFTYTIKDGDGDTSTATFKVTLSDSGVTNLFATNALVDEDNIAGAGGNANGPGDDAAAPTGHISYAIGADGLGSVALSTTSNATDPTKLDGTAIGTVWDGSTHTLTGYGTSPSDVVFRIVLSNITATGADYTTTLLQPVKHPERDADGLNDGPETAFEGNLGFTVNVTVKDVDNSQGTTSFTVTIDDDTPSFISADHGFVANTSNSVVIGDLLATFGADGPGGFSFGSNSAPANLTVGGHPVLYDIAGDILTARVDLDNNGIDVGDTQAFTLTLNADGTYTFNLLQPLDATVETTVTIGSSTSFGAGPAEYQVLSQTAISPPIAILSSPGGGVNGSTAGWGVTPNNNFNAGEVIRTDFGADQFTGTGLILPDAKFATFELSKYNPGDKVNWVVHYTNGTQDVGTHNFTTSNETYTFQLGDPSKFIAYVEFTDVTGAGKFDLVDVFTVVKSNTGTLDLSFNINASDGDHDSTAGNIVITLDGSTATIDGTALNDAMAGDSSAQTINGLVGNDDLYGNGGNDTLVGGSGLDTLTGGAGADHFGYNATTEGLDNIIDFSPGTDVLDFKSSAFGNLTIGTLSAANFDSNATGAATHAAPEFIYNTTTHVLSFDADGTGAAAAIQMAHLENGVTLTNANIHIVA